MEDELKQIQEWLKVLEGFGLPAYKELPSVPLYMEQVVGYINEALKPLCTSDQQVLTSFMVNNYVKAKIIDEPVKKKYNQVQLGYLMAISTLKITLSMSEISLLIEMDNDVSTDKSILYGFFRVMANDILKDSVERLSRRVDTYAIRFNEEKAKNDPKADVNLRDSLGLIALRLSIQAGVNEILSSLLLDAVGKDMHGEKAFEIESTPGAHEMRRENKISGAEAKRLVAARNKKLLEEKEKTAKKKTDSKKEK